MRHILTLIALSACNFIGDKDQQSRLDPDKDGVNWPDDCNDNNPNIGAPQVWYIDEDGDGFGSDDAIVDDSCTVPLNGSATGGDCDDTDDAVYPTAPEIWYNGVDNDCLGGDDYDQDGDGETSSSYNGTDCDDTNPAINTSAEEIYYDGVDQDCDNNENECDQDGDGFDGTPSGDPNSICPNVTDCDDTDPTIYPNDAVEIPLTGIDEDCNFQTGDGDEDGDGFWAMDYEAQMEANGVTIEVPIPVGPRDCWDDPSTVPTDYSALNGLPQLDSNMVYPDAENIPYDGIDADCSGGDDFDNDGDGFGSSDYENRDGEAGLDCDDDNGAIFPGAFDEFYDGVDSNCDGLNDYDQDGDGVSTLDGDCNDIDPSINSFEFDIPADGVDQDCNGLETCYIDGDFDGFGSSNTGQSSAFDCSASGFSANSQDCDDSSALTYPGAAPLDSQSECMRDLDGDNYGDDNVVAPIIAGTDCDDSSTSVNTGALELTDNNTDDNCDGEEQCYIDADEDGYRTVNTNLVVSSADLDCEDPGEGQDSDPATDCNDALDTINPGETEIIDDGIDQDCDGGDLCYVDTDSDGFRNAETSLTVVSADSDCNDAGEGNSNEPATDCDDSEPTTYPGAPEIIADGVDQDCDQNESCYVDADSDGFRNEDLSLTLLSSDLDCDDDGEGAASEPPTDCNDSDSNINPAATETVDNVDEDCDGIIDNNISSYDDDGDGYSEDAGDCDDSDLNIYPYADEVYADGIDSNCDDFEANNIECEGAIFSNGNIDSYVLFCDNTLNWSGNNSACISGGYDGIASIYSATEQTQFEDIAQFAGPNQSDDLLNDYWIGLTDSLNDGAYYWISDPNTTVWLGDFTGGSPNGLYANWDSSEPSNQNFNCAFVSTPSGAWMVDDCSAQHQVTCEARPVPTP